GVYQWMTMRMISRNGLDEPHILHADSAKLSSHKFSRASHIPRMLRQRRDRRNAQQSLQFLNKTPSILAGIFNCGRRLCGHHDSSPQKLRAQTSANKVYAAHDTTASRTSAGKRRTMCACRGGINVNFTR